MSSAYWFAVGWGLISVLFALYAAPQHSNTVVGTYVVVVAVLTILDTVTHRE